MMSFCWESKVSAETRVCEYDLVRIGVAAAISGGKDSEKCKQIDAFGAQQVWKLDLAIQIWKRPNSTVLSEARTGSPCYKELVYYARQPCPGKFEADQFQPSVTVV